MHTRLPSSRIPIQHPALRYAVAIGAVLGAFALRVLVGGLLKPGDAPYGTFYLATIVTVWVAGRGPAVLAAILGGLAADYYFTPPLLSFVWQNDWNPSDVLWLF